MKKVFISQPMNGKTQEEIQKERREAIKTLQKIGGYGVDDIQIIDSIVAEEAPQDDNIALWYLSKSIEFLAQADIALFARGWEQARGCKIEYLCAKEYGLEYVLLSGEDTVIAALND